MDKPSGVGSQLKKMFSFFLIHAGPDCPCHAHAAEYDVWGPEICLKNMELIIDRLEEQASIRGIPFNRWLAKRFVRVAINKASRGRPL